jgi:hypothetical protein
MYDNDSLMVDAYEALRKLEIDAPHVGHVYPFPSLLDALRKLQGGTNVGKVVVNVTAEDEVA